MNSTNPHSSDFSYKKYSLEQLDNWVNDALNCEDLTPEDIHDTIVKCVDESVKYHKKYYTKSVELLSLLKGHREVDFGVGNDEQWDYTELDEKFPSTTQKDWIDFWEETYYPEEHQQYTSGAERYPAAYVYTDEEMNAMCDAAEDKEKCREYNLREAEYYNKRAQLDADYEAIKAAGGYDWTPLPEKDKVKKWRLPVEEVENGDTMKTEYFVTFPDDLLEAASLKEGDNIEWVDQGNGSYLLKKVEKEPMTYDEMVDAGWTMTADGFWIKD